MSALTVTLEELARFFADSTSGAGTSLMEGWRLNITAVPEPINLSLISFAGAFALIGMVKAFRYRSFGAKTNNKR